jgi:hypothetical protein
MEWENVGNSPLESTVAVINDFMPEEVRHWGVKLPFKQSVETFTGYRIPANKPIVGDNVLHKPLVFMLMVTIKTIYILMIYSQNVLEEKRNIL